MRVAPRANLTIALLHQQIYGVERFVTQGSESVLNLPAAIPAAITGRVDIVQFTRPVAEPELPHTCCLPCQPSATDRTPTPIPPIDPPPEEGDDIPPPTRPNPYYEPADGGGVGLIDLLA